MRTSGLLGRVGVGLELVLEFVMMPFSLACISFTFFASRAVVVLLAVLLALVELLLRLDLLFVLLLASVIFVVLLFVLPLLLLPVVFLVELLLRELVRFVPRPVVVLPSADLLLRLLRVFFFVSVFCASTSADSTFFLAIVEFDFLRPEDLDREPLLLRREVVDLGLSLFWVFDTLDGERSLDDESASEVTSSLF